MACPQASQESVAETWTNPCFSALPLASVYHLLCFLGFFLLLLSLRAEKFLNSLDHFVKGDR